MICTYLVYRIYTYYVPTRNIQLWTLYGVQYTVMSILINNNNGSTKVSIIFGNHIRKYDYV